MATLTELARFQTPLSGRAVSHLQRLVAGWGAGSRRSMVWTGSDFLRLNSAMAVAYLLIPRETLRLPGRC